MYSYGHLFVNFLSWDSFFCLPSFLRHYLRESMPLYPYNGFGWDRSTSIGIEQKFTSVRIPPAFCSLTSWESDATSAHANGMFGISSRSGEEVTSAEETAVQNLSLETPISNPKQTSNPTILKILETEFVWKMFRKWRCDGGSKKSHRLAMECSGPDRWASGLAVVSEKYHGPQERWWFRELGAAQRGLAGQPPRGALVRGGPLVGAP